MQRRTFLAALPLMAGAFAFSPFFAGRAFAGHSLLHYIPLRGPYDLHVRDYIGKMRNFDAPHQDDIYLSVAKQKLLSSSFRRIKRIIRHVGYGHFNLLSFDDAIRTARQHPTIGAFSKAELTFLEGIFYSDAAVYGFYGTKPISRLTQQIRIKEVEKVPYSGNYLYKGPPIATWQSIRKQLGNNVVLTSGVRGVMKQFYLFLNKAYANNGNLSLASRSLAPPGYSFHGVGDFDVGRRGFGEDNFTSRFIETNIYKELSKRGYLTLRYPQGNMLGVRFEPWHVKVKNVGKA